MEENKISINNMYIGNKISEEMQEFFQNEGFLQLTSFLEKKQIMVIEKILKKKKFELKCNPMQEKKSELNLKGLYDFEIISFIEFFKSKYFLNFIEKLTGFELIMTDIKVSKYKQSDFTILHDKLKKKDDQIKVIFDLSDDWDEKNGGILTFTTKREEIFYLEPSFNSLNIIYNSGEIISYLKYINNLAKDKKIIRVELEFDFVDSENY